MDWTEVLKLDRVWLNLGGKHEHHPRTRYAGYVSVDLGGGTGWSVQHVFPAPLPLPAGSVHRVLSEHFLEHLDETAAAAVLADVCRVLRPGALFRLTVPDVNHPAYVECRAAGRDLLDRHHHSIWDDLTLSRALILAGFAQIRLVHHWDAHGVFHQQPIDYRLGWLKRTPDHDRRNRKGNPLAKTSLVIDAVAPWPCPSSRSIAPARCTLCAG